MFSLRTLMVAALLLTSAHGLSVASDGYLIPVSPSRNQVGAFDAEVRAACVQGGVEAGSPESVPNCLQAEGTYLFLQGRTDDALERFLRAEAAWAALGEAAKSKVLEQGVLAYNLGVVLGQMGRHREAAERLQRAVAIHEEASGSHAKALLRSLCLLGSEFAAIGRERDAEWAVARAVGLARATAPEGSADFAMANLQLAGLRLLQLDLGSALTLAKDSEEMARRFLSTDSPEYADILVTLASLYRRGGDTARAQPILRKAVHIYSGNCPGDGCHHGTPRYITALRELGCLQAADGRTSLGAETLRGALRLARVKFGPETLETALIENDLGLVLTQQGPSHFAEAEALFAHSLSVAETVLGPMHRDVGVAHENLALLYDRWRRKSAAVRHHSLAAQILPNLATGRKTPPRFTAHAPKCAQPQPLIASSMCSLSFSFDIGACRRSRPITRHIAAVVAIRR